MAILYITLIIASNIGILILFYYRHNGMFYDVSDIQSTAYINSKSLKCIQ